MQTAVNNAVDGATIDLLTSGGSSLSTQYRGVLTIDTPGSASRSITIQPAPGVTGPVLDAGPNATMSASAVVNVSGDTSVTLDGLTIEGGNDSGGGGGIVNNGPGTVTLVGSTVRSNYSYNNGGGIANESSSGTVKVIDSSILANTAAQSIGGAIYNHGTLVVTDSTLQGNRAGDGGAIFSDAGQVTVTSSTVTGNTLVPGPFGGSISVSGGSVSLGADLLATPGGSPGECDDGALGQLTVTDLGYNVSDDSSCVFSSGTSISGRTAAEDLGPLANNGGLTETVLPLPANPAVGLIPPGATLSGAAQAVCSLTDQRGFSSVAGGTCDAGSVQVATQLYAAAAGGLPGPVRAVRRLSRAICRPPLMMPGRAA